MSGARTGTSSSSRREVSYAQQRATFFIVYPPPPTTSMGMPNDLTYSSADAWPAQRRARSWGRRREGQRGDVGGDTPGDGTGRTLQGEVEAPEAVAAQRVRAALHQHRLRAVKLHDVGDDGTEDLLEGLVVHAVAEGEVDAVALALARAHVLGAGERRVRGGAGARPGPSRAQSQLTSTSPVPGKYSPYLWKEQVMTRSVV